MDWHDYIEQKPGVLCGKPVIKGTRISVEFILERLSQGASEVGLLNSHPQLKPEHIKAALGYAAAYLSLDRTIWFEEVKK